MFVHYGRTITMKALIVILIQFISITGIFAQNTFSFLLEDSYCKIPFKACESSDNKVNVIIAQKTGNDYGPQELIKGYLVIFSPNGDTTVKNYNFGDTTFSFYCISELSDGFLLAGEAKFPGDSINSLLVCKLDTNRNLLWHKFLRNSEFKNYFTEEIFSSNNSLFLCGAVRIVNESFSHPYLIKLDENGNTISEIYYPYQAANSCRYLFPPDSSKILLLTSSSLPPINYNPSISYYDLELNFIKIEQFYQGSLFLLSTKWYNSNTFLITSKGTNPGNIFDNDIIIDKFDTLYNHLLTNNYGSLDTSDKVTMFSQSIDFVNKDTIFFGGYKNNIIGPPHTYNKDWIIVGQVDSTLQQRFIKYIGGDAYYETNYIIATHDGGVFVCAGKFNHDKQLYDLLFLKLNNEGILVNTASNELKSWNSIIWPNPVTQLLNIELGKLAKEIEIIDLMGNMVKSINTNDTKIKVDLSGVASGVYIVRVIYENDIVETHKLIKK
jgi:hypothetical protein